MKKILMPLVVATSLAASGIALSKNTHDGCIETAINVSEVLNRLPSERPSIQNEDKTEDAIRTYYDCTKNNGGDEEVVEEVVEKITATEEEFDGLF